MFIHINLSQSLPGIFTGIPDAGEVFSDKVSGNRPVHILLPGIMGSNLEANNKKIWINYICFLAGELTRLDISKQHIEAVSLI